MIIVVRRRAGLLLIIGALCRAFMVLLMAGPASGAAGERQVGSESEIVLKTVPPKRFLYSRHHVNSLQDVLRVEWTYGPKMLEQVKRQGLRQVGGIEYHVVLGDGMYVDVAVPIDEFPEHADSGFFKTTASFDCLSLVFVGSPLDLESQWSRVENEARRRGLTPSGENREIIVDREGFDSGRYVTELQLGVR